MKKFRQKSENPKNWSNFRMLINWTKYLHLKFNRATKGYFKRKFLD